MCVCVGGGGVGGGGQGRRMPNYFKGTCTNPLGGPCCNMPENKCGVVK